MDGGVRECHKLIERMRKKIEMSTLFPSIPKEKKLRRWEILEKQLKEKPSGMESTVSNSATHVKDLKSTGRRVYHKLCTLP